MQFPQTKLAFLAPQAQLISNTKLNPTQTTAVAAVQASYNSGASAIVVLTSSGTTAKETAKYRPTCPILAVTRFPQTARQLQLHRGVIPILYDGDRLDDWNKDVDTRVKYALAFATKTGFVKSGDNIICITGWRQGAGASNTIMIE